MTKINPDAGCMGKMCSWNASAMGLGCTTGGGDCFSAVLTKSSNATIQDRTLEEATEKINEILSKIPNHHDPDVKLSIITTPNNVMLAWVNHKREPQKGDVNSGSTKDEISDALGIIC